MARSAKSLLVTDEQERALRQLVNRHTANQREVRRAWIIIHRAEGLSQIATAKRVKVSRQVVMLWEKRFRQHGLAGLQEASGRGRPSPLNPESKAEISIPGDPLPSSIELSPLERDLLELIIHGQTTIHGPSWQGRAILFWSNGTSNSTTAQELKVSEEAVRLLRQRWLSSMTRIAAKEEKVRKEVCNLIALTCEILSEESPQKTSVTSKDVVQTTGIGKEKLNDSKELRSAARALIEILHHKPMMYGINRSNWSQASLAEAYWKQYGQKPSKSTVGQLLRDAGISWRKSQKFLTSPDPNYREKVELLLKTLHSLKANEELFFADELGPLQVKRYGGRCYTPKGEKPGHPQNPRSKGSITLYGALSATTNQVTWFYGNTKDSAGMMDLVEILFNQYHHKSKIYLTWDAASWHGSNELVEWTDALNAWNKADGSGPTIEFVPLPSSAQFLDVIEAVFSGMKRAVVHSSDYQSVEEMKTAISRHFRERNEFFKRNPKRVGKKIWDIDFFKNPDHIRSGNYREW